MRNNQAYDIIGDIHGHADELKGLLGLLGYMNEQETYEHPEGRKVIFVGDYIDRGPKALETLQIVRGMVEAGAALAILGNHEINALRFHTYNTQGEPLRPHTPNKIAQHRATLDQLAHIAPEEWADWMTWLSALPLWLDLGDLRVVHAAWHPEGMRHLEGHGPFTGELLENVSYKGTPGYDAISLLINGMEAPLKDGKRVVIRGSDHPEVRIKWWANDHARDARTAIFPPEPSVEPYPIEPVDVPGYPTDAPPVFFGHYAVDFEHRLPASNVACVDHAMGKGGGLSAYRWDGEQVLDPGNFVTQRAMQMEEK